MDKVKTKKNWMNLLTCFIFSLSFFSPPYIRPAQNQDIQTRSQQVDLWEDDQGNIWVSTPHYTWNLTEGETILAKAGQESGNGLEIGSSHQGRLIDQLFINQPGVTRLKTTVLLSLDQVAWVYLEKNDPENPEGLGLVFRASDPLITLTHYAPKGSTTTLSRDALKISGITDEAIIKEQGYLKELIPGQDRKAMNYSLWYNKEIRQGFAILSNSTSETINTETSKDCKDESLHYQQTLCRMSTIKSSDFEISREYLYIFQASPNDPLSPLQSVLVHLQLAMPDLNVALISRLPRYGYEEIKKPTRDR
jgi:hypothetical protein